MNDNLSPNANIPTPDLSSSEVPTAFCQQCGKPLTAATARPVGASVFCEPCLIERVAPSAAGGPFGNPTAPPPGFAPVNGVPDPGAYLPPIYPPSAPNPGLATLLGFIPGVGAMYNEQYAKGIVHLIVFVVLIMLTEVNGIFGIFIAGWVLYMAVEAHHTAQARRDGLPLPNPFNLNDIGERLGFGKAWPGNPSVTTAATDAVRAAAQQASAAATDAAAYAGQSATPPPYDAAQAANYAAQQAAYAANAAANPYPSPNWTDTHGAAPMPPFDQPPYGQNPYGAIPTVTPPPLTPLSRFPAGAVWLIALGCIFLLATTGIFEGVRGNTIVGLGLMTLGGWIFFRRMAESGLSLTPDGSSSYLYRINRACRGAFWLFFIGLWILFESFHLLTFHRTWPLILIFLGVLALLERVAYNNAAATPYYPAPAVPPTSVTDQKGGN